MDTNDADGPDYYLLIDLYLEGWLDKDAMAEVNRLLETDGEFRKQATIMKALREQAKEVQEEAASERAVRSMLQTIAGERRPISRLRHIKQPSGDKWLMAAIVTLVAGVIVGLYLRNSIPSKPPIVRKPTPVIRPDSSRRTNEFDDQLAGPDDTLPNPQAPQKPSVAVLMKTRPLTVFVREKDDDSFGLGTVDVPTDTLTARFYRVTGQPEYELRPDTLNVFLPQRMLTKGTTFRLYLQPDSTFRLTINKDSFQLRRGGRRPLR